MFLASVLLFLIFALIFMSYCQQKQQEASAEWLQKREQAFSEWRKNNKGLAAPKEFVELFYPAFNSDSAKKVDKGEQT